MIVMEPALDVLNRALQGDSGARSFLDRTSSIYLLDVTDVQKPKTYGCWNFIHQAMNEVERMEAIQGTQASLTAHVQLLVTMALRVARRSTAADKRLVATCIDNAAKFHASANEARQLIDLNVELRDIVMGRIAAMAFDDSFHRQAGAHANSAFADAVAMETFCAVLAANAVSNGPAAVDHLVTEWIGPSASCMPPFALACVTLHLASEALRKSAPVNTQDMLQRLSNTVIAGVLAPILTEAVKETNVNPNDGMSLHGRNNRIAAVSLRAMDRWCEATDLSLAQIKHVCSKVDINIVDVVSDAMYSDSRFVIDALAELIDHVVERHQVPTVSEERMTQVRYIMQVDEVSFRSNVAPEQLITIESKEMEYILTELISAIGLQRFRFIERQNQGDDDVCRNLTRIASSVCMAIAKARLEGRPGKSGPGLLDLLMKAAAHPSVSICGLSMEVLSSLISIEIGLSHQLLPTLQRRAITPHHYVDGQPSLAASDICGVNFHEFQNFRDSVLTDALVACYKDNGEHYVASCTAAIEEFCSDSASTNLSFHLEAALFCLAAVADEALGSDGSFAHSSQLERCIAALAGKPESLTCSPLTLVQLCRFLRKYHRWYGKGEIEGVLDIAAELALSTFTLSSSGFPGESLCIDMKREGADSPYSEAAHALKAILSQSPQHFLSNHAIAALGAGWEASYAASNRPGIIDAEDRQSLCFGICHVLASLPDSQRAKSLHALAMPTLDCLETMTQHANHYSASNDSKEQLEVILDRIAEEISVLTTMARTFTNAFSVNDTSMESGCRTSDGHAAIVEPAFAILRIAWPSINQAASHFSDNENVASALGEFLVECLPPECQDNDSVTLAKELCSIASAMLQANARGKRVSFEPILNFLRVFVKIHGDVVDKNASYSLEGRSNPSNAEKGREMGKCLEDLLLACVGAVRNSLGTTWTSAQRQGQGQPPFETKAKPVVEQQTSNEALPAMFSLLRVCAERCPIFLTHLPAAPGLDRNEDLLYRRSVESAVTSLLEADVETCESAMEYLEATVKLTESSSDDVRHIADETLSRVRSNIVTLLVVGSCGRLNGGIIGDAANLLLRILSTSSTNGDSESILVHALQNEHFLLGNEARTVSLRILMRCTCKEVSASELTSFLGDLWELHQIEYSESMEGSDAAARFCRRYSS